MSSIRKVSPSKERWKEDFILSRDGIKAFLKPLVQEGVTPFPQDFLSRTVTNSYLGTCSTPGNRPGGQHLSAPKV